MLMARIALILMSVVLVMGIVHNFVTIRPEALLAIVILVIMLVEVYAMILMNVRVQLMDVTRDAQTLLDLIIVLALLVMFLDLIIKHALISMNVEGLIRVLKTAVILLVVMFVPALMVTNSLQTTTLAMI